MIQVKAIEVNAFVENPAIDSSTFVVSCVLTTLPQVPIRSPVTGSTSCNSGVYADGTVYSLTKIVVILSPLYTTVQTDPEGTVTVMPEFIETGPPLIALLPVLIVELTLIVASFSI